MSPDFATTGSPGRTNISGRPSLYMPPGVLGKRLEILKRGCYRVLPLGEGLQRLQDGKLRSQSVAIYF